MDGSSYLGQPLPFSISTLIWIEVLVIGYIEFQLFSTVILVSATTPLDDERVRQRFTFYTDGSDVAAKIAPGFAAEVERQFDQDIPIWESKSYVPVPALAPNEKPATEFRKWAAQFYAEV